MASATFEQDGGWRRWARWAIPVLLLAAAAWLAWTFAHQVDGVRREAPSISTLIPVQEPPPPPPPTVKPPPEPKPLDEPVAQPAPQQPQPAPQAPSPAQPTAGQNAVTENAPAQSGSDAFNIGAGSGAGGRGSGTAGGGGFAETAAMYGQYAKAQITRAVRSSAMLRGKQLRAVILVWFDASGHVVRVELAQGSGVSDYDAEIKRVVAALALRAPGQGILAQMPIHFSIDERLPL
jgi:protein TonB